MTMQFSTLMLYIAYGLLSATGILALRTAGASLTWPLRPDTMSFATMTPLVAAAVLYAASFALWAVILARSTVSTAYPICFGLTLVLSVTFATTLLGETLTMPKLAGMAFVFVGVILLTR